MSHSPAPTVRLLWADARPSSALQACLQRLGVPMLPDATADEVRADAMPLIVHGRGTFETAARALRDSGTFDALRERIRAGMPTFAIGSAFQLFARASEESPGVEGLGILDIDLQRFGNSLPVPQLGWNVAVPEREATLLDESFAYFNNAYAMARAPRRWAASWSEYDGPFVAALECGAVVGCQFHPELSGGPGLLLIHNWLQQELVAC